MDGKIVAKEQSETFTTSIRMVTKRDECHQAESTTDSKPVPVRKQTALDVANMIAPSVPSKETQNRSGFSIGAKPLDLSHRGLPASSSSSAYKTFYPYPTLPISSTLSPYSYLGEAASSAITPASYGTGYGAYPLYGSYPVADSTAPPLSTLRLSALLASRKRRAAASSGEKVEVSVGVVSALEPSRKKVRPVPEEKKDSSYWDRRRKNNDAAKRSRDARREKEEEIALRAVFLEQENMKLRAEVSILKSEMGRLHYMVYNC
ncbi:uncharacterized protein [Asterias amurensis]|uniref:uncharacterized protein n=1 Tax=Asterias amurensis TaxID=7602 RepID=UPI003AB367F6